MTYWPCPSCHTPIPVPRWAIPSPDVVYRCHVCRVDLMLDDDGLGWIDAHDAALPGMLQGTRASTLRRQS